MLRFVAPLLFGVSLLGCAMDATGSIEGGDPVARPKADGEDELYEEPAIDPAAESTLTECNANSDCGSTREICFGRQFMSGRLHDALIEAGVINNRGVILGGWERGTGLCVPAQGGRYNFEQVSVNVRGPKWWYVPAIYVTFDVDGVIGTPIEGDTWVSYGSETDAYFATLRDRYGSFTVPSNAVDFEVAVREHGLFSTKLHSFHLDGLSRSAFSDDSGSYSQTLLLTSELYEVRATVRPVLAEGEADAIIAQLGL